jgi:hypothetical protein
MSAESILVKAMPSSYMRRPIGTRGAIALERRGDRPGHVMGSPGKRTHGLAPENGQGEPRVIPIGPELYFLWFLFLCPPPPPPPQQQHHVTIRYCPHPPRLLNGTQDSCPLRADISTYITNLWVQTRDKEIRNWTSIGCVQNSRTKLN